MQVFDLGNEFDDGIQNDSNGNIDVAFKKINKNYADFLIWRVENLSVVALTREQYGTFYDTESYIIYAASQYGSSSGVDSVARDLKGKNIEYHIHFWLGSNTTPEKSGVAAYKTVELDGFLGCCSTQHRETQENESSRFLSYFKSGFRILKSALLQNGNKQQPKLYKVKGKCVPSLVEMSDLSWENFKSSDVFVIKSPQTIFVWIGRAANVEERRHAAIISQEMKDQHKIPNIVFVDDGYEKSIDKETQKQFSKYLPLEKRVVLPNASEETNGANSHIKTHLRLYKCSENNGKYRVAEVKNGPLSWSDLSSDDVFIIDQEIHGIWVWVGKRVNEKERNEALRNARGFVKKKKYPSNTKVTRIVETLEPTEFKVLFKQWKTEHKTKTPSPKILTITKFDPIAMEERPSLAAETQLIDDGSGGMTLWRIKNMKIVEIPKDRHGYFFTGDCYIALYSYQTARDEKHLLYCWIGSNASQDEINITTTKLTEIDEELGQLGFQARIIQGRETAHFLQLFKGKLTVFNGRGIDFDDTGKNLKNPNQYLLKIHGSTTYSAKAEQVEFSASSLDSNSCFVLKRGKKYYVWCGNYSTGDQREMAKGFAGKDFELLLEGKEKDFVSLLGGPKSYFTQLVRNEYDHKPPRLFFCNSSKKIEVQEILFFQQKDLLPENVMLLDTNDALYIWIGKLSAREDQRLSIQTALNYLQNDPSNRDMNMTIIHIKQGKEPPTFIGFFPGWDKKLWKHYKTFAKIRQEIEMKNTDQTVQNVHYTQNTSENGEFDQYEKYPINILKEPNERLPSRVDSLNKELHLTNDDFVYLFKMPYADFEKLPKWKRQEMKKRVGLF